MGTEHSGECWRVHLECCYRQARAAVAALGLPATEAEAATTAAGRYLLAFGRLHHVGEAACPSKARAGRQLYACSLLAGHVGRCEFQL